MSNLRSDKRWVLWMLEQSQRAKGARTRRSRAGGLGAALISLKGLLAVSEIGRISNHVYLILQFQLLQILEQEKPLLLFTHKHICSSLIYCTYSWTNRASWVGNTARTAISLSQLGSNHWPRHGWSHSAEKSKHHPITLPVLSVKAPARSRGIPQPLRGAGQPAWGCSKGFFSVSRKRPAKCSQAMYPSEHTSVASLFAQMSRL